MRIFFLGFLFLFITGIVSAQQAHPAISPSDSLKQAEANAHHAVTTPHEKNYFRFNPYLADTLLQPVPLGRVLFHDRINNEQRSADSADGRIDGKVVFKRDSSKSFSLTQALQHDIDRLQVLIENMPANGREDVADNQLRIQCLRALWEMLRQYNADPKPDADYTVKLVANMHDMLIAANEDKQMDYELAHPIMQTLDNGMVLLDNHPAERAYIYSEMGRQYPMVMVKRLTEYAKDTFASDIIKVAARLDPALIFNYALSSNILLKGAVYRTEDPFVQAIVEVASNSAAPLKAFPFLADLYLKRKTIGQIDTIADNPTLSYENLVRLRLENEPLTHSIYTKELEYRTLKYFVRQMNELHDTVDAIRFACIDSLPASSLYFIMVNGQDEIYTSSFLGTFRRMLQRMAPMRGDQLLDSLHYDHFRTFIRMCANYNTLSDFLATVDDTTKTALMSRFAGGLQNGRTDDLEDAVDVADAFGSIRDTALFTFLQKKVKENYNISAGEGNKKGMAIYSLLSTLIESNRISGTDTGAAAASALLKIPPINKVPFSSLINDSGTVYQRVFFYGDEDGKTAYDGFLEEYSRDRKWKVENTKYWMRIVPANGRKIVIYANLPLKSPDDEVAIDSLNKFFADSNIHPSVVIHRGHSYHVKSTLATLDSLARIVVLGSCGGYQNLAIVLAKSPDAHIISSKQTGVGAINEPITRALNDQLLAGADIDWIPLWHNLDEYFAKRKDLYDKFTDYVPPHKNMGVIFIKAYKQMMNGRI